MRRKIKFGGYLKMGNMCLLLALLGLFDKRLIYVKELADEEGGMEPAGS